MKFVVNLWILLASLVLYTTGPLHDPLTDLPRLLLAGVSEKAIVERCERVQFRSSGGVGSIGTNLTKIHDIIPVAVTANGIEARGWYKFGKDWCNRQVGQSVSVLIHPDDPERSKINTYVQLWLLPVHVLAALTLFAVAAVFRSAWRYVFFGYLALVSGAVLLEISS